MNVPFDLSFTIAATETPVIKKPLDSTDNLIVAAILADATFSLADVALSIPTVNFYLTGLVVTVSAACKVEFGVYNGSTFVPLYATQATHAAAGGFVREFDAGSVKVPHLTGLWRAAFRVTGDATGTIKVSGDLGIHTS